MDGQSTRKESCIRDSLSLTEWKGKECSNGQMVESSSVTTKMARNMGKEPSFGQVVSAMRVSSRVTTVMGEV